MFTIVKVIIAERPISPANERSKEPESIMAANPMAGKAIKALVIKTLIRLLKIINPGAMMASTAITAKNSNKDKIFLIFTNLIIVVTPLWRRRQYWPKHN